MSYHSQAQTQQRSIGLFAVVAFHVIAGFALLYGLKIHTPTFDPPPLKVDNILEKTIKDDPVVMPTVDLTKITPTKPVAVPDSFDIIEANPTQAPSGETQITAVSGARTTIEKARILKATKPAYPSASTRLGEEGITTLNLFINEKGKVTEARIVNSSGYPRLDDAAIKHVLREWTFTPCRLDEKIVSCWQSINLVWKIENSAR